MKGFIKKIEQINFGLMSPDDIREMSVVTVETPDTYEDDGFPIERGVMDPRMGVIDPSLVCRTCGFRGGDCHGHFGSIELARPVIHIGFGDVIHKILRSTCNNCGRLLLPEEELEQYTGKIAKAMENKESIAEILKKLQMDTKKVEMPEAKQNEIVDKIMSEIYPGENDYYDNYDREYILINLLNQLYAEAYMERDETEEKPQFKYIDPKLLCPHCKKNKSLADIEASYEILEEYNSLEFNKIFERIVSDIEKDHEKEILKIDNKIDKKNEKIDYIRNNLEVDSYEKIFALKDEIEKLNDDKASLLAEFEEKFEEKVQKKFKKHIRQYIKQFLQELIQEPILLDKPVTIRQGYYKLTPSEVRERLENISDEDSFLLGVNPEVARPEWMVLTVLPVPPVNVRPSITLDTGERSEDDLTHKLVDILRINQRLVENMEAGAPQLIVEDLWELLQYHVTTYFDNESLGLPPARHRSGRELKTLTQRLKGKEGRFRSNLSGKRVNFSARTVISPDPNISINEVGVPEMIAKEVTVPVYVTEFNIKEMEKYILNGPDVHPGANYIIRNDGRKIRVRTEETKELILEQLEPGFIIERHLKDGDIVLLNRQPSLHRMSVMAHEVRVLPYKTFRINPCVCPPYNADFDGDEMNMHILQTDESRAEAKSLMLVQEHMLSPRFGGPIIGAIHDHISGAFLLTRWGSEFTEEEALQIIRKSHLKIPEFKAGQWILKYDTNFAEDSFIYKDKGEKWTGKELFSLLLPNDFNIEYATEIANGKEKIVITEKDSMTGKKLSKIGFKGLLYPTEGYVVIENGILKQGVIDESAFGSFSGKILDKIIKEYGTGRAKEFLDRATDLAICGIMKTGITTSLNDEEIPSEAQDRINNHLDMKMDEADKLVESYEEGYLQALPGRNLEETLELKIMQVLGEARDMSGQIVEDYILNRDDSSLFSVLGNNSAVMAKTGARSSMLNLTQITACVGQQSVRGGRIERGYLNRTLPHFKKGELGIKAKGFVHSSYKSGLDPIEFFFHAMAGREGLVDTAIRIAQSGYMQRRLVNALQDLSVDFKGVVKDNQGNVIQTMFGEDGVDPAKSDFGKTADLNRLIHEIRMENNRINSQNSENSVDDELSSDEKKKLIVRSEYLQNKMKYSINEYRDFVKEYESETLQLYDEIDNELVEIDDKVKTNLDKLNFLKSQLIHLDKIDDISIEFSYIDDELESIKKRFYQKLSEINKEKFIEFENSLSKFEKLLGDEISLLEINYGKCSSLESQLEKLIIDFNNLMDFKEKSSNLNNLNKLQSELKYIFSLMDKLDDRFNGFKWHIFENRTDIDESYDYIKFNLYKGYSSKLRDLNHEFNEFNSSKNDILLSRISHIEDDIKKQRKIYNERLEFENKVYGSEEIKKLIYDFNQIFENPFLDLELRNYSFADEEFELIKQEVVDDIIDGNIKGDDDVDFMLILISYCEKHKGNKEILDDVEFEKLIANVDLTPYDSDIVDECKIKVKNDFDSNRITKDQIKLKFTRYLSNKQKELAQLSMLDEIRSDPNVPVIKIHLTEEQCDEIYDETKDQICSENGLRGSVLTFIENKMNKQLGLNKSEARVLFESFSYSIVLSESQIEDYKMEFEYLIDNSKIKIADINEEFIIKTSHDFVTYGKIRLE